VSASTSKPTDCLTTDPIITSNMAQAVQSCTIPKPASNHATSPHLPAHAWSYRVPSPPRIVVPPPVLNNFGVPNLAIGQTPFHDYESSEFANADFLDTVTYGDFVTANNMLDWKYEQRRMAQNILPFLFLGPTSAARDKDFLKREGITMLLAVRNTMSAQAKLLNGSKVAGELGLQSATIDVAGNQELIAAFPRAIQAINSHMQQMYSIRTANTRHTSSDHSHLANTDLLTGKVLVFCESGNERSAGVVAAYLMAMYNMDIIKAVQIVQAQRFCVSFDDSLKVLLQTFAAILQAKRDVARSQQSSTEQLKLDGLHRGGVQGGCDLAVGKKGKRNLDEAYESDIEMGDASGQIDDGRFEGREGYAPFQDKALI